MIQKLNENFTNGTPLSAKSLNKIVNKLNEISEDSKLNLSFTNGNPLCADDLNAIKDKINELIDKLNSQTDDVYGIKVIKYSNNQFDSDGGTYSIKAYVTKNGKYYSDDVTINSTLENDGENFIIPQSDTDLNYGIEITSPYGDKTITITLDGSNGSTEEDRYSLYVSEFPSTVSTDGGTVTIVTSIQKNGVNNTSKGIQVNLNYPQGVTSSYKDNGVIRTYTITFPKNETFNSKVLSGTISAGTIGSKNVSISQGATAPTQTIEVYANGGGNVAWDANSVTFSFYAMVNGQSITIGVTPEIVTNEVGATLSNSNNGSATYTVTKNTGTSNRTLIVRAKYLGKYSNNVSFLLKTKESSPSNVKYLVSTAIFNYGNSNTSLIVGSPFLGPNTLIFDSNGVIKSIDGGLDLISSSASNSIESNTSAFSLDGSATKSTTLGAGYLANITDENEHIFNISFAVKEGYYLAGVCNNVGDEGKVTVSNWSFDKASSKLTFTTKYNPNGSSIYGENLNCVITLIILKPGAVKTQFNISNIEKGNSKDYKITFEVPPPGSSVHPYGMGTYTVFSNIMEITPYSYCGNISYLVAKNNGLEVARTGSYTLPNPSDLYGLATWVVKCGNDTYEFHYRIFGLTEALMQEHRLDSYKYTVLWQDIGGVTTQANGSYTISENSCDSYPSPLTGYIKFRVTQYPVYIKGFVLSEYDIEEDTGSQILAFAFGRWFDNPNSTEIIDVYDFNNPNTLNLKNVIDIPNQAQGDAILLTNNVATSNYTKITFKNEGDGETLYAASSDSCLSWQLHIRDWGGLLIETLSPDYYIKYVEYDGGPLTITNVNSITHRCTPTEKFNILELNTNGLGNPFIGNIKVCVAKNTNSNKSILLSYDTLDWPIRDEEVILGMTGETFLVYARRYEDGSPAADMSLSKAPIITIVGDGEYMLTLKSVDVNGHDYVYEYEVNNDLYENAHFTISAEFDGLAGANTLDLKQGTSGGNLCYCILTTDKGEEYISKLEYWSSGTGVGSTNRMDVRGIDYHAGSYELTYKFVMYKDGEKIPTTGLKLASIRLYGSYAKEDNWYTCSTLPEGGPGHPDGSVTSIGEDTYKISMTFTESPEVYWRAADLELQVYFSDGSYLYIDSFVYLFPYIYLKAHTDYSRSWQQLIYGEYGVNPITCEGGYPMESLDPGYSENIYLDCYKYDNDINSYLEGSYTLITSTDKGTPRVRLMDSNYQTGQLDGLEYEPVEIEKLEESEYTSYAKTYHLTLKPNHSGKLKIAVYFADLVDSNGNIVYTSEDTYTYGYEVQFLESC